MPQKPPSYKPAHHRTDRERRADVDKHRGTRTQRGYDNRWARRSKLYLMCNPVCVKCGHPSQETDHIIPLSRGGVDDESNYQALCKACHSAKTAREQSIT